MAHGSTGCPLWTRAITPLDRHVRTEHVAGLAPQLEQRVVLLLGVAPLRVFLLLAAGLPLAAARGGGGGGGLVRVGVALHRHGARRQRLAARDVRDARPARDVAEAERAPPPQSPPRTRPARLLVLAWGRSRCGG